MLFIPISSTIYAFESPEGRLLALRLRVEEVRRAGALEVGRAGVLAEGVLGALDVDEVDDLAADEAAALTLVLAPAPVVALDFDGAGFAIAAGFAPSVFDFSVFAGATRLALLLTFLVTRVGRTGRVVCAEEVRT